MQIKWFPSGMREIEREGEREKGGERIGFNILVNNGLETCSLLFFFEI